MTVGASFTDAGYYVAGTSLPDFTNPNKGKNTKQIVGWILIGLALLLLFGYAVPVVLRKTRPEVAKARRRGPD
jgi:K+-transporting ATPase A subunit